jgi:hypothetical protein
MVRPGRLRRQGGSVAPEGESVEVGRAGGVVDGGEQGDEEIADPFSLWEKVARSAG